MSCQKFHLLCMSRDEYLNFFFYCFCTSVLKQLYIYIITIDVCQSVAYTDNSKAFQQI